MAQLKSTEDFLKEAGVAPVNAEDLQAKFDAVTKAEYDKQRTTLQDTENKFYNQLYDTQKTTMDTIRQSNAQAVATGASRGVQAANELSALLGLQQESVEGATDIANQATTLAQDETQAFLENALNAEQQAQEANQALATILMQRESVGVEQQNANTAAIQALGTLEAQARADGNTALADYYKNIMTQMQNGTIPNVAPNTGSSGTGTNTGTGTGAGSPPALDPKYQNYGAQNTDGTFTTKNGITGTLDTTTDLISNTKGTYDLNGKLLYYNTTNNASLFDTLAKDGYNIDSGVYDVIDFNAAQSSWGALIDQVDVDKDTLKGKAGNYIKQIQHDAAVGKIPVGSIVQLNYGRIWSEKDSHLSVYLGNGKFASISDSAYKHNKDKVYIPSGYKETNPWFGKDDNLTIEKD